MKVKTLVILAKSYKRGGWCIAGRELIPNPEGKFNISSWIRPVTGDEKSKGAVFDVNCLLTDGTHAQVLDIVEIPIASHAPEPGQPENYLIVEGSPWKKLSTCPPSSVSKLIESPSDLWLEPKMSTDRITSDYDETHNISQSLYLINPLKLRVILGQEWNDFEGKYKKFIKASFDYNQVHYEGLSITDPKIRKMLGKKYPGEGEEPNTISLNKADDYHLCASLGPRFGSNENHYKFIATIIDFDGYIQRTY